MRNLAKSILCLQFHFLIAIAPPVLAQEAQTTAPAATAPEQPKAHDPLRFTLTYDSALASSFTGRVYVMLSHSQDEPRFGPSWFGTEPFFAVDTKDWKPDQPLEFNDNAIAFPIKLSMIDENGYSVQAVMRRNIDSATIGEGKGTAYSQSLRQTFAGDTGGNIALRIDQVVPPPKPFKETDRIKLVELRSTLLSDFFHRDIIMRASIVLPKSYDADPKRMYPALYWIGGFGSDHRGAGSMARSWDHTGMGEHIVRIVLDPSCYGGHHMFADSENNGPRGKALIEEFIPYLEKTYRLVSAPTARFVSGHSSGGWSSLWLQTTYPDFFGGVWSIAPDPVDFRDFQRINLYHPGENMYTDSDGKPRPLARAGDRVLVKYEQFAKMEVVYGEGGQLRSFEWVFSKRGDDGKPQPLYNRATGAVNKEVAETWKPYDIRLNLEQNWSTLGPKLAGKLQVFVGDQDTFYLDGAVVLLKASLERLKSDAVVIIEPGKDHGSIASPALRERIDRELLKVFQTAHPEFAKPITYD